MAPQTAGRFPDAQRSCGVRMASAATTTARAHDPTLAARALLEDCASDSAPAPVEQKAFDTASRCESSATRAEAGLPPARGCPSRGDAQGAIRCDAGSGGTPFDDSTGREHRLTATRKHIADRTSYGGVANDGARAAQHSFGGAQCAIPAGAFECGDALAIAGPGCRTRRKDAHPADARCHRGGRKGLHPERDGDPGSSHRGATHVIVQAPRERLFGPCERSSAL